MSKPYRDHTCSDAVNHSDKEWKEMARLAILIRKGNVSQDWIDTKKPLFTGIFKRLLTDPIDDVYKAAG